VDGAPLAPEQVDDPMIGQVLLGTYRVERCLGAGGMARVYRAVHDRIGRPYAVKVLSAAYVADETVVARFFQEARAAAALDHPGIVRLVDVATMPDGIPFMVLEHLEGEDAQALLEREGPLAIDRVVRLGEAAAAALSVAHEHGIVHRDIKPSNLFLARGADGREQVKLLDFGIARLMGKASLTAEGQQWGTPEYMSPEQARGNSDLDHRADIYALGATLFALIAGRPPFTGPSAVAIIIQHLSDAPPPLGLLRGDVPHELESLVVTMLAKDPAARPASAAAVQAALALHPRTSTAGPASGPGGRPAPRALEEVGEIRVVAVLVADIELQRDRDLESQLQETAAISAVLAEEVEREGGTLDRLVGNRAVGIFGLRLSFGDEPVRAVRAAMSAMRRLHDASVLRIVVGTGRTLSRTDAESASAGPAASAAARLLGRVRAGTVVVDAATFVRIRSVFGTRPLPGGAGAGVDEAHLVERDLKLVGLQAAGSGFDPDLPTVGRDDEMAHLWDAFAWTVEARQPSVAFVLGEAGIGKSRLKTDLAYRIAAKEELAAFYLEGAGQPLAAEHPFSTLGDLIRRRAHLAAGCTQREVRARISALVSAAGIEIEKNLEALVDPLSLVALGGAARTPPVAVLEGAPERLRERIIDAFVGLVTALARQHPVVLCVEDAHHVDRSTLAALGRLLRAAAGLPVLVLVVGHPETWDRVAESELAAEGSPLRITLRALSRSETRTLLAALLGAEPPSALHDVVWERAEGVPLFVEEVLFALRQQGALQSDPADGSLRLVETKKLLDLPDSVHGVLQARLDALPPELKQIVRQAAVVGTVFWDDVIAALNGADCAQRLSALARRQMITAAPQSAVAGCRQYEFRSAAVRAMAYESIPGRDRAALHSVVADWLAAHDAAPTVLAHHFERAGRIAEAVEELLRAGEMASRSYANEEAIAHFDAAVALSGRCLEPADAARDAQERCLGALQGKELVLARLGRRDEALAVLDRIGELARARGDRPRAVRASVRRGTLVRLSDLGRAEAILEDALRECRALGVAELECTALCQVAQAAADSGKLERGAEAAAEAVAVARAFGAQGVLLDTLVTQGTIATLVSGHWLGLAPFEEALEIARRSANAEVEADLLQRCGFLRSELGDLEAAERDLVAARELCQRTGTRRILAFTEHHLGWVLWKLGRASEAAAAERIALEVSAQSHLLQVELETEVYLALFDLGEDRPEPALDRARTVFDRARRARHAEPELHAIMAETLALGRLGRTTEAADRADAVVEAYGALGRTQQFEVELHLAASGALGAAGRPSYARQALATARAVLRRRFVPIGDPSARARLARGIGLGLPREVGAAAQALVRKLDGRAAAP
jgi:serine/threonine protein kinase/tetratricopeptide (TPR) repeat protein